MGPNSKTKGVAGLTSVKEPPASLISKFPIRSGKLLLECSVVLVSAEAAKPENSERRLSVPLLSRSIATQGSSMRMVWKKSSFLKRREGA